MTLEELEHNIDDYDCNPFAPAAHFPVLDVARRVAALFVHNGNAVTDKWPRLTEDHHWLPLEPHDLYDYLFGEDE